MNPSRQLVPNPQNSSAQNPSVQSMSLSRQVIEFFASLCIAVALFKSFAAEGYLISTGSMAPTLLGHHRNVVCPACHHEFSINLGANQRQILASCPNCTFPGIRTDNLPRQDGDQLLVNRIAYEFRNPRRWEVVVFRNPDDPTEAYVKRLAGFPGEKIQLQRGDLLVNGELQRKPFSIQQSMRILVHDHDLRPGSDLLPWKPRWRPEGAWRQDDSSFQIDQKQTGEQKSPWSKLEYAHWIRIGGNYTSIQTLDKLPEGVALPSGGWFPVEYKPDRRELTCRGVMGEDVLARLTGLSPQADYQTAIRNLCEESHLSPVGDFCAYNAPDAAPKYFVPDLMLNCSLEYRGGNGAVRCTIDSGRGEYSVLFDFFSRELSLWKEGDKTPLRTRPMPAGIGNSPARIDFSVFDQQALLAINGQPALEPVPFRNDSPHVSLPRRPVRIEAHDVSARVSHLRLYRDVYYTPAGKSQADRVYSLANSPGKREHFFLGDNSPVSLDSRFWKSGQIVDRKDFLGQPFLVHLPARTRTWKIGAWEGHIRVPDFSRIRYIR